MPLRISAVVELVSLAVLLTNMATLDTQNIAALVGPIHGIAWLFGVLATWRDPRGTPRIVALAVIPGFGGLLALRALTPQPTT
jgi:hypothetical protein